MQIKDIKKLNPFGSITNSELIGIEFSTDNLKIVAVIVFPNKKEVTRVLTRDIKGLADEEISKVIVASVKELKIKKPTVAITIPSQLVITKNIEVPSVDPKEIKGIINLQAGRHTPYSREEIIIDYIGVGTYRQNYTKILLLIVTSAVIKKQFAIMEKAGIKVDRVLLSQEGMAILTGKIFKSDTMSSPVGAVVIGESSTDFTIMFRNRAIFIRSIPMGRQQLLTETEKFQTKFSEEIKKSLEAYQTENIEKNPYMLILAGTSQELAGLDTVLNDAVHLPVRIIPYLDNIPLSNKAMDEILAAKNLSFLNVIAPLLAFSECKVNLIPEEIKLKWALQERGKDLILTGMFSLSLLVLIFMILISKLYFKSTYLKNLNMKFKSLATEAQNLEKDFQWNSLIRNYLSTRGISFKALVELHEIAPLSLELNEIRFDREGKFVIRGTAESMSAVFSFADAMGKSKYFKEVKTKYATKRQEGKKDVTDFEINSLINKAASQ
jgi:type IV pilus assembly protein PilM